MARKFTNKEIPVKSIRISELHWEREHTEEEIAALANSIDRQGQLHQITVRPIGKTDKFELISGKKRLEAVKKNGEKTIRAAIVKYDDEEARITTLQENLTFSTLTASERAAAKKELRDIIEKQLERERKREQARKDQLANAENRKASRKKGNELFLATTDKSRGRPKSTKRQATQRVAKLSGDSEEKTRREIKRKEDLIATAVVAYEEKQITADQADRLATMSAEDQMEQLPIMMRETQKETRERLARQNTSAAKGDTAVAVRMLSAIYDAADNLAGLVNEVLSYMDSKELEYSKLLELDRQHAKTCSTALTDLVGFLESD